MKKRRFSQDSLLDVWSQHGDDRFELANIIGDVANATRTYVKRGSELTWYVVTSNGTDEVLKACPADPMKQGTGRQIKLSILRGKGSPLNDWDENLWNEAVSISKIFVSFIDDDGSQKMLAVTSGIGSDFANLGITGPVAQRASYHLLGLVAEQTDNGFVTLVTRNVPGKTAPIEKVIALRSGRFAAIPQDDALALASEVCSDGDIAYWNIDNFLTEVVYTFPQSAVNTTYGRKRADFIPYIRYFTSDAGDSSCSFELGWNVNATRKIFLASGGHRVFRTHRGEWNEETRDKLEIDALKLKEKFVLVSEKMNELSKILVLNQNIEKCVRNLCSDVQIKNKGAVNALVEHVTTEFVGADASAAEIIISMIEAQDTENALIDMSNAQRDKMHHKFGELIYQRIRQYA